MVSVMLGVAVVARKNSPGGEEDSPLGLKGGGCGLRLAKWLVWGGGIFSRLTSGTQAILLVPKAPEHVI
jgi:hypothetical protein